MDKITDFSNQLFNVFYLLYDWISDNIKMPEPTAKANGSWFIKGSTDNEMLNNCKNETLDAFNDENHGGLLLHKMFERFLDDHPDKSEQTALIEYLEGEKVENMKTISYRALNEQANRLARILIRKLGKTSKLENDENVLYLKLNL